MILLKDCNQLFYEYRVRLQLLIREMS